MTREQYLGYRNNNKFPLDLLYDFYVEKCTENCMNKYEFFKFVNNPIKMSWFPGDELYFNKDLAGKPALAYFDAMFNVVSLHDAPYDEENNILGKVIKFL